MPEKQNDAINKILKEGDDGGITIKHTVKIWNPHVNARKAIMRERNAMVRHLLRSLGFIPYKKDKVYIYVPANKLEAQYLNDVQSRRIKPARTMVRNAVKIAISIARQPSLFADTNSFETILELEAMKEEFENAAQTVAKEIAQIRKAKIQETTMRKQKKAS